MEINLKLTQADWVNFNKFIQRNKQKEQKGFPTGFWGNMILWLFLVMIFTILFRLIERLHWPTAAFVSFIFILMMCYFFFSLFKLQKAFMPSIEGTFVGSHKFIFDENGINSSGKGYKSFHEWTTVKRIERSNNLVLIFIDTAHAFIFPESQLADDDESIS